MDPSLVPAVIVAVLVIGFGVAVLVALALERPDPAETAVAYEEAWDRLDFDTIWRLSAHELRDERTRDDFIADKQRRYQERGDLAGVLERVQVETLDTAGPHARAVTRLILRNGDQYRNELRLRREGNRWAVVQYRIRTGESPVL